jgi:cyclopropane fatty-acyl-phospholipid synthase-like methyltransferase
VAEINLLNSYPRAKRDVSSRHAAQENQKSIAMEFGKEYFDGDRTQGYGGYRYDGRWIPVAKDLCEYWQLKSGDRILDIGCAKGFLIKDLMSVCPGLVVFGMDISMYAITHAESEVEGCIVVGNAAFLPFPSNYFNAAISINTIHNLEKEQCFKAICEMQRVAPNGGYIQVDSYRTSEEKELFLKWVLTAKTHYDPSGWKKMFSEAGYTGDYYWTITE